MSNTKTTKDILKEQVDHEFILDCVSSMHPLNINAFLTVKAYFVESLFSSYSNTFSHVGNSDKGCDVRCQADKIEIKSYKGLLKPKKSRKDGQQYTSDFVLVNSRNHITDRKFEPADFYYLIDTINYSIGIAPGERLQLSTAMDSSKKHVSGKFLIQDVEMLIQNHQPNVVPKVEKYVNDLVTGKFVQVWRA